MRGKRDMPAPRAVQGDPVERGFRNGTGPSEPYPPSLRNPHFSGLPAESAHLPWLDGDIPKALVTPGLPPRGLAVRAREETRQCLSEVPQRLLLYRLAPGSQPPIFGASLGKLPALLQVSRRAVAPRSPPRLLLDCEVPHKASMRAVIP